MIEEAVVVGLVVERRQLESEWSAFNGTPYAWRPVAIFPVAPDVAPWTPLGGDGKTSMFYVGPQSIRLFSTDTANYRSNLESAQALLWVALRETGTKPPIEVATVTADPAEGEALTEAGTDTVETIAMPNEVAAEIAAFIVANHVERPIIKRRRGQAEPDVRWRPGEGPRRNTGPDDKDNGS